MGKDLNYYFKNQQSLSSHSRGVCGIINLLNYTSESEGTSRYCCYWVLLLSPTFFCWSSGRKIDELKLSVNSSEIIKLTYLFRIQCSFRKMKSHLVSFSIVVQLSRLPYWTLLKLLTIYAVPEINRTESSVSACQGRYDHPLDFFFPLGFLTLPNLQWTPCNICFHRILLNLPSLSDWVLCLTFRNREIMILLVISITREKLLRMGAFLRGLKG